MKETLHAMLDAEADRIYYAHRRAKIFRIPRFQAIAICDAVVNWYRKREIIADGSLIET